MVGDGGCGPPAGTFQFRHRAGERAAVGVELLSEVAQVAEHLLGHVVERADVLVHAGGRGAGPFQQIVHGGDKVRHPYRQNLLDRPEVALRTADHVLQQPVGLAQALEQRGRVRAQHAVRFHHFGNGGRRCPLRLFDRLVGRVLQAQQPIADRLGRPLAGVGNLVDDFLAARDQDICKRGVL